MSCSFLNTLQKVFSIKDYESIYHQRRAYAGALQKSFSVKIGDLVCFFNLLKQDFATDIATDISTSFQYNYFKGTVMEIM